MQYTGFYKGFNCKDSVKCTFCVMQGDNKAMKMMKSVLFLFKNPFIFLLRIKWFLQT